MVLTSRLRFCREILSVDDVTQLSVAVASVADNVVAILMAAFDDDVAIVLVLPEKVHAAV